MLKMKGKGFERNHTLNSIIFSLVPFVTLIGFYLFQFAIIIIIIIIISKTLQW